MPKKENGRNCPWWNAGAMQCLEELKGNLGLTWPDIAEAADVTPDAVKKWRNGIKPRERQIVLISEHFGVTVEMFQRAAEGKPYVVPEQNGRNIGHPHSKLREELARFLNQGENAKVEFLMPPGFLRTRVLHKLAVPADMQNILVPAGGMGSIEEFWTGIATRLRLFGYDHLGDDYFGVHDSVKGRNCLLAIDDADQFIKTLSEQRTATPEQGRRWLKQLSSLPCKVLVAGMFRMQSLIKAAYSLDSDGKFRTLESPWCDEWESWSRWVFQVILTARPYGAAIKKAAHRHPVALLEGARGGPNYAARIDETHNATALAILARVPATLKGYFRAEDWGPMDDDCRLMLREAGFLPKTGETAAKVNPGLLAQWRRHWPKSEAPSARGEK